MRQNYFRPKNLNNSHYPIDFFKQLGKHTSVSCNAARNSSYITIRKSGAFHRSISFADNLLPTMCFINALE